MPEKTVSLRQSERKPVTPSLSQLSVDSSTQKCCARRGRGLKGKNIWTREFLFHAQTRGYKRRTKREAADSPAAAKHAKDTDVDVDACTDRQLRSSPSITCRQKRRKRESGKQPGENVARCWRIPRGETMNAPAHTSGNELLLDLCFRGGTRRGWD